MDIQGRKIRANPLIVIKIIALKVFIPSTLSLLGNLSSKNGGVLSEIMAL
jgi:hypothetical protein